MVQKWILKRMKSEGKKIEMTLLYKLTNHGDSSSTFHSYCNNKGYTLTLIRNTKGYRCGGFTSQSWSSSGNYKADPNAFLFSLEFKEYYPTYDGTNAIYDNEDKEWYGAEYTIDDFAETGSTIISLKFDKQSKDIEIIEADYGDLI